jgi:hypothetical protein
MQSCAAVRACGEKLSDRKLLINHLSISPNE